MSQLGQKLTAWHRTVGQSDRGETAHEDRTNGEQRMAFAPALIRADAPSSVEAMKQVQNQTER